MPNIDDIIEQLLGDRRLKEGAAFSSRTYSDQPLIERGSDFKARMEQRSAERARRHANDARVRRERAETSRTRPAPRESARQEHDARPHAAQGSFSDWIRSLDLELGRPISNALNSIGMSPTPQPIKEMRRLENGGVPASLAYGSSAMGNIFYQQAKLMADYEDDYEFNGTFSQYYPTYAAMSDHQLRGYFSWRTKIRQGQVNPAPLSFAFVYVYELLCGIGTTPGEQGLRDLRAFGQAYQETDERLGSQLNSYLLRWERDYAIYHCIPQAMRASQEDELGSAVLTLMRAEHAQLRAAKREPKIANDQARGNAPTDDQLFHALGNAGTYHICESRLAKDDPELVSAVALDVFSELVMHCSKRRKTDYVEGLFGYALRTPYTMFAAAVFYDPDPHPDCTVTLNERESFTCKNGHWYRLLACEARNRSAELGLALHAVDYELRKALDYAYPLKERKVPKYLTKMVRSAIAKRLEERAEAERRRITIDLSKLSGIRAAAAVTQEALLTDEERGEEPTPEPTTTAAAPMQMQLAAEMPAAQDSQTQEAAAAQAGEPASPGAPAAPVATGTFANPTPATTTEGPLTPLQIRFLTGLMDGTPVHELLSPTDPFPSVVADSINETFFDLVGDAVIEFDGDTPLIVEDYLDDIREVLQA